MAAAAVSKCSGSAQAAKMSPSRTRGAPLREKSSAITAARNSPTPAASARRRKSSCSSRSWASSVRYTAPRNANVMSANSPTESGNGLSQGATYIV